MRWDEYSNFVRSINFTENADKGWDLLHQASSLCSEAGELMGKVVKKEFRGYSANNPARINEQMEDEMGDIMYHFAALCNLFNTTPEIIWTKNAVKLESRVNRGVLVGEGDNR